MPTITIELTDTQAGKVMAANGWKPEELGAIVKRLVFEYISATAAPAAPSTKPDRHKKPLQAAPTERSTNGSSGSLVTSGEA